MLSTMTVNGLCCEMQSMSKVGWGWTNRNADGERKTPFSPSEARKPIPDEMPTPQPES
jgi:hypothetical protein